MAMTIQLKKLVMITKQIRTFRETSVALIFLPDFFLVVEMICNDRPPNTVVKTNKVKFTIINTTHV